MRVPPSLRVTFIPFAEPVMITCWVSMPRNPTSRTAGLVLVEKVNENRPFSSVETPCPPPPFRMTDAPGSTALFVSKTVPLTVNLRILTVES